MIAVQVLTTDAEEAFAALRGAVRRRILRRAMRVSTRPIWQAMRVTVRAEAKESGALASSIGQKTKFKKGGAYTVIGARRNYVKTFGKKPRTPKLYAHIIDKGRQPFVRKGIRVGGFTGINYTVKTFTAHRQQWYADMTRVILEDLEKEMNKLPKPKR